MNYLRTPLALNHSNSAFTIGRDIKELKSMIDNLVELIIFTPKGSFLADPEFGFEYWNHEYTNINYKNFNSGQAITASDGSHHKITKDECRDSLSNSLSVYAKQLSDIKINIEITSAFEDYFSEDKSRHTARIIVEVKGKIDNGLGTFIDYSKSLEFFTDPTVKKRR